ncbi:MAG: hypothetical protein HYY04_10425, partial [Chloroflexi bacterium]|nr:hypothetical protein [Chloroflexota bacterium]
MDKPLQPEPSLTPEQARLMPFYHDLRNEIVEPDKVVVATQYFWTRWPPLLGPTLTALVVTLRRHCYYNRITKERRDWCFPEQATLAREIGVDSTKTVRAALTHPFAHYFVRRQPRYLYDPALGKKVRTSDMYFVAMDDPLTPDDEQRLCLRAAERLLAEGREAELTGRLPDHAAGPPAPPTGDFHAPEPPAGQMDRLTGAPVAENCLQHGAAEFAPEEVLLTSTSTTTTTTTTDTPAGTSPAEPARGTRPDRPNRLPRSPATTEATEDTSGQQARSSPSRPMIGTTGDTPGQQIRPPLTGTVGPGSGTAPGVGDVERQLTLETYAAANNRPASPAEAQLLHDLAARFATAAGRHGAAGWEWVRAAIGEAVASGSAFVAPRRIERILSRWASQGREERRPTATGAVNGFPRCARDERIERITDMATGRGGEGDCRL